MSTGHAGLAVEGERQVAHVAGSEKAAATIGDLQSRGYDVQVNYDNGLPNTDLSQCWVNGINTADATGTLKTVYVDIECPKQAASLAR